MPKFTPLVRVLLTALAVAISALAASADALPTWTQIALVVASTALAGLGIVPPTVPTATVVPLSATFIAPSPPNEPPA